MTTLKHAIIDLTAYTPGDVDSTAIYVAGVGYLRRSTDGGQTYTDLLPSIGTPPNDAGDSPAPTNADLTCTRLTQDLLTGDLYVTREWDNGTDWRHWISKYDGSTWTHKQIGASAGTDPDTAGVDWIINMLPDNETGYTDGQSITSPLNAGTASAPTAPSGNEPTYDVNEFGTGRDAYEFTSANSQYWDFGTGITRPANWTIIFFGQFGGAATVGVVIGSTDGAAAPADRAERTWGLVRQNNSTMSYIFGDDTNSSQGRTANGTFTANTPNAYAYRYTAGDTDVDIWTGSTTEAIDTTVSSAASASTGTTYDMAIGRWGGVATHYLQGHIGRLLLVDEALTDTQIENFLLNTLDYYNVGSIAESRPLGVTMDNFASSALYTCEWANGTIKLFKRDKSSLVGLAETSLGAATETEINNRTYYAQPYSLSAPNGSSNTVYVFGRWNDGGVEHLVKSTDGGATVGANIGGSWTTGWVSEFFALNENTMFAFVAGASRALHRTDDGGSNWTNLGSLPFDVDSASLSANGVLCIVNRASGSQQVAVSSSPFSTWADKTGTVDTTGGKVAVRWV